MKGKAGILNFTGACSSDPVDVYVRKNVFFFAEPHMPRYPRAALQRRTNYPLHIHNAGSALFVFRSAISFVGIGKVQEYNQNDILSNETMPQPLF